MKYDVFLNRFDVGVSNAARVKFILLSAFIHSGTKKPIKHRPEITAPSTVPFQWD